MSTNKKIFLMVAVLFIATMIYITFDIFSRTTRPGAKKHLIESIKPSDRPSTKTEVDSTTADTLDNR
jgi:hypothetical protein